MTIQKGNAKDIKNYRSIILFGFLMVEIATIGCATSSGFFFYLLIYAIFIPIVIIAKFKLSQLIGKAGLFRDSAELFFGVTDIAIAAIMFFLRFKDGGFETCFDVCVPITFPEAFFRVIIPALIVITISVFINLAGYKSAKFKS